MSFSCIKQLLKQMRGIDISIYNDSFLSKSLEDRMTATGCDSLDAYSAYLEQVHAEGEILHSVTGSAYWKCVGATIEADMRYTFSARQYTNGVVSGEFECRDNSFAVAGLGKIYDMKVSGDTVKIGLIFTSGNSKTLCNYSGDITKLSGWVVVVDNRMSSGVTGPQYISMTLFRVFSQSSG